MSARLLLADDSITIQKVVGIIFAGDEYELTIVDNGSAALVKAKAARPDVLLVDAVMPGMTGYEVCEEIRRDPLLQGVPILLLTGAFEPFDEEKARKSGADDFISKPFESQSLIDKVTSLIGLGKERAVSAPAAAPQASPVVSPAPPVVAPSLQPPPPAPAVQPPAAPAVEPGDGQFTVEVMEASHDDDLWGAFDLEDVATDDGAPVPGEQVATDDSAFVTEVVEEDPFSFAEELETIAEPATSPQRFEPVVEEEPFSFADELEPVAAPIPSGPQLEVVAEEDPFSFADEVETVVEPAPSAPKFEPVGEELFVFEEEAGAFDVMESSAGVVTRETPPEILAAAPQDEFDIFGDDLPGNDASAAFGEPPGDTVDFFADVAEPVSEAPPVSGAPAGAEDGFELEFASEEEYITLPEPEEAAPAPSAVEPPPVAAVSSAPPPGPAAAAAVAQPVAATVSAAGEVRLSEEQIASLVARISREVIEKIAWEVVPDLAEAIIREEIRKIREGQ